MFSLLTLHCINTKGNTAKPQTPLLIKYLVTIRKVWNGVHFSNLLSKVLIKYPF